MSYDETCYFIDEKYTNKKTGKRKRVTRREQGYNITMIDKNNIIAKVALPCASQFVEKNTNLIHFIRDTANRGKAVKEQTEDKVLKHSALFRAGLLCLWPKNDKALHTLYTAHMDFTQPYDTRVNKIGAYCDMRINQIKYSGNNFRTLLANKDMLDDIRKFDLTMLEIFGNDMCNDPVVNQPGDILSGLTAGMSLSLQRGVTALAVEKKIPLIHRFINLKDHGRLTITDAPERKKGMTSLPFTRFHEAPALINRLQMDAYFRNPEEKLRYTADQMLMVAEYLNKQNSEAFVYRERHKLRLDKR